MNLIAFQKLMKEGFDCKAHLDQVPEKARLPAIAYRHSANSAARLLDGTRSGRSDTWAVVIVTKSDDDIQSLVEQAELLHNSNNDDYQRVFITLGSVGAMTKDEVTRNTTLTIQTFEA